MHFMIFWAGFEMVLEYFVLPTPPLPLSAEVGVGNRATHLFVAQEIRFFFHVLLFFILPTPSPPPRSEPGETWVN